MIEFNEGTQLACILRSVVRDSINGHKKMALMFSGGLDSAVLAIIARKSCDIRLYTIGMDGSHDLEWASQCAALLDLPYSEIIVEEGQVASSIERVVSVHGMRNPSWMSTFVSFDMLLAEIHEEAVMCGQGADELFGGYRKYLESADARKIMADDARELIHNEWPSYLEMAKNHGKLLMAPYLDRRVVEFAGKIPISLKISESENKLVLRAAADYLGVPGMMAYKKKKAMQYGSGISKAIKQCLKDQGKGLGELMDTY